MSFIIAEAIYTHVNSQPSSKVAWRSLALHAYILASIVSLDWYLHVQFVLCPLNFDSSWSVTILVSRVPSSHNASN